MVVTLLLNVFGFKSYLPSFCRECSSAGKFVPLAKLPAGRLSGLSLGGQGNMLQVIVPARVLNHCVQIATRCYLDRKVLGMLVVSHVRLRDCVISLQRVQSSALHCMGNLLLMLGPLGLWLLPPISVISRVAFRKATRIGKNRITTTTITTTIISKKQKL